MHINQKIDLLIRASRLYCHGMYQKYDPKYHPAIKGVVLNFTNKLFGTKPVENKVKIDIRSLFEDEIENRPGWKVYSGIRIYIEFPDNSAPGIRAVQTSTYTRRRYLLQTCTYTS